MRVLLAVVGKVRPPLADAVAEYERRAARYWKLAVEEVAAGGPGSGGPAGTVLRAEAERLLARIPDELEVVALTRVAKGMNSRGLARYLDAHANRSSPGVAFVIGGALGLHGSVFDRARRRLALSPFTLTHEMARLVLTEQLYRAGTIVRGEPYHKG